ncbi:hypothetical protein U9M48_042086, partial [Paspalum notatum var. saurae]
MAGHGRDGPRPRRLPQGARPPGRRRRGRGARVPRGAAAGDKPLAYYALREELRAQLAAHPNATVVVTGHSLGGALAAIFPALLAFHGEQDILDRLQAVVTYGQPRVGDQAFTDFVRAGVPVEPLRVVYRYDVVPRVPFDAPPVAEFVHGGTCVYFDGWYDGRAIAAGEDVPNPNYFDPRYLLSMYGNAWGDLFKGAFLWAKEGKDYREGACVAALPRHRAARARRR